MGNLIQKIEKQFHLKCGKDKKSLNTMRTATHIYLFSAIVYDHNNQLHKKCFEKLLQFFVKRNDLESLVYVIPSCSKDQSELETTVIKNDGNLEQCQSEFAECHADVPNNLKTYINCQLDSEATVKPIAQWYKCNI